MAKFQFKSLLDTDKVIYAAPLLTLASFFHIFSRTPATHSFGQIEVLAAMVVVGYYLWEKIAAIYPLEKIGKKRIEAVVCVVVSIFLALIPLAPLMTWQYFNLYRASDRYSYNKQIIIAIATIWVSIITMYSSSYVLMAERMASANQGLPESSMPAATEGQ